MEEASRRGLLRICFGPRRVGDLSVNGLTPIALETLNHVDGLAPWLGTG